MATHRIELTFNNEFIADVITSDTEHYDDLKQPDDGWTIEPKTQEEALDAFASLVADIASDLRARYDDDELRARIAALLTEDTE